MINKSIIYLLIFFSYFFFTDSINSGLSSEDKKIKKFKVNEISNWKLKNNHEKINNIEWNLITDIEDAPRSYFYLGKIKNFKIRSLGKAIEVNGKPYPEISNYINNAFVESSNRFSTISLRGISKTRHCQGNNFSYDCIDGVLDLDFNLINKDKFSFNPKINVQSLSNRKGQTSVGDGVSLGFKLATFLSEKFHISFGGENIIHLDDSIDMGRNFYLLSSTYYQLNEYENPAIMFINFGIGSDFYGYKGNGYIARTSCLGRPNLTGNGSDECNWGPIGSISLAFNDRIALVNEWFGYGYGSGISIRPLQNSSLNISLYATDFIKGFPSHVEEGCHDKCETRYYGTLSFSF